MTFLYWNISILLCFYCVSLAVADAAGELPAPVNPQVFWLSEFCPRINWTRPDISDTCVVNYTIDTKSRPSKEQEVWDLVYHSRYPGTSAVVPCMSREKDIRFIITTVPTANCKQHSDSEPFNLTVPHQPEVVKDFMCGFYTNQDINCTWLPSDNVINLQSYYWFPGTPADLNPCPLVMVKGSQLIGCHLNSSHLHPSLELYFLINGTRGNSVLTSTFKRSLRKLFKPPPPEVTINLTSPKTLRFSWDPLDFDRYSHCIQYKYNYSECGNIHIDTILETSVSVDYVPECRYSVSVKTMVGELCGQGESEPSRVKYYEASEGSTSVVPILVVISVGILGFFCVLLFFFFHKYKEKLLPKIPEPSLGVSVRGLMELLYVPVKEEVEISLEVYPNNGDVWQDSRVVKPTHTL